MAQFIGGPADGTEVDRSLTRASYIRVPQITNRQFWFDSPYDNVPSDWKPVICCHVYERNDDGNYHYLRPEDYTPEGVETRDWKPGLI